MLSYPNCHVRSRSVTSIPNLVQLARLMEEWKLDFRVILLDRSPESILISTLKRKFEKRFLNQCDILSNATRALTEQLEKLDRRFLAGGCSIERNYKENLASIEKHWIPNLRFSRELARKVLHKFKVKTPQLVASPKDQQTEYANSLTRFYSEYAKYRLIFDSVF